MFAGAGIGGELAADSSSFGAGILEWEMSAGRGAELLTTGALASGFQATSVAPLGAFMLEVPGNGVLSELPEFGAALGAGFVVLDCDCGAMPETG